MVASLLKIVSTGMQDERLQPPKDQPDLGAFLTVMMKTGRYGTAWARIDFDTKPEFGQSAVIRLPVQGELIGRIILVTTMPDIKTQQDKAYKARNVPKLYSKNYQSAQLVQDFQYVPVYKNVYAKGAPSIVLPPSIIVLKNLLLSTGLPDAVATNLMSNLGPDLAVIYGSSVLYAYKNTYTMGPGNVPVGDIDIAFKDRSIANIFAKIIVDALGPTCIIKDQTGLLYPGFNSIQDGRFDTNNYKLNSSSAPVAGELMGSFNVNIVSPANYQINEGPAYTHDAVGEIRDATYPNTTNASIRLPGKTAIQLVVCDTLLIGLRTLSEYIQQTMDFTAISGTFDGTTLIEPYSNLINTNIAVYTEDIPVNNFDWMLYRLLKFISRGFTIYFQRQAQINAWNAITKRPPLWGADAGSSTVCPFRLYNTTLVTSFNSITVPTVPYQIADFSGVQLDDLRVGATYTLNFSSQSPSVFSLYLTDSGLPQSTFNTINRDNLILAAPNNNFISYSYDTINWTSVTQPSGVYNLSQVKDIQWNGTQWLAAGTFGPPDDDNQVIIGSSNPNIKFNVPILRGISYSVAWNGQSGSTSLYVMIGNELENIDTTKGSISKSTDGINWSASYTPISTNPTKIISYTLLSTSYSDPTGFIVWNGTRFIASGYTVTDQTQTVSGMMYSTDGVNWTLVTNYTYYSANPDVKSIYPKSRGTTIVGRITLLSDIATLNITSTNPRTVFEIGTIIYGNNIPSTGAVITAILNSQSYIIGFQGSSDVTDQTMFDFPRLTSVVVKKIVWNGLSGADSLTVAVGLWEFSDFKRFGIASSSDGIHWTVRGPEITATDPTPLLDVCWTGYIWIAIGRFSNNGEISTSSDAINWNTAVLPNNTYGISGALSIGASPTAVIIIGNWPTGSIVRGSSNKLGYNWLTVKKPTLNLADSITINCIAYSGYTNTPGIYIAGGAWNDISTQYGALSYSTDGINWSGAVFPDALQYNANGDPGAGFTNGVAWSGFTTPYNPQNPTSPHSSFIAVGNWYNSKDEPLSTSGSFSSSICRSVDGGRTWPVTLDPGPGGILRIRGIGYGILCYLGNGTITGYWIAVGQWGNNTIAISDNVTGATWSQAPSNGGINFNPGGIAYGIATNGEGRCVIVGKWSITIGGITKIITIIYGIDNGNGTITWTPVSTIFDPITDNPITDPTATGYGVFYNPNLDEFIISGSWTSEGIQYSIINISVKTTGAVINTVTGPLDQEGSVISGVGRSIANNGTQTVVTGQWGNNTIATLTEYGWIYPVNPERVGGTGNICTGILWNINTLNWVACGNWFDQFNTNYANISIFTYGITWYQPFDPPNSFRDTTNTRSTTVWDPYGSQWVASGKWFLLDGININFSSSKSIITSSDGIIWSRAFDYPNIISPSNVSLQVAPSGVLVLGFWSGQHKFFTTSPDGIIWSPPVTISNILAGDIYRIAWNGTRWVAAGFFNSAEGATLGGLAFSLDGISWSIVANSIGILEVVWNGTIFLAFGTGYFISSSDGVNWSPPVNISFYAKSLNASLVWNGSFWIIGSQFVNIDGLYLGSFSRSIDGINWTTPVDPVDIGLLDEIILPQVYSIAYNGSIYIAVGLWKTSSPPYTPSRIYYMAISYDGIQWRTVGVVNIVSLYSIKWNGTLWIAGGGQDVAGPSGSVAPYNLIKSYDGINWTGQVLGNNLVINTLATKRTLPYTDAQLFSPLIRNTSVETKSPVVAYVKDSAVTWTNDPVYKNGTNYQTLLSSTNSPTFTFTATKRTQWLTFGTYYNLAPVTITLTLLPQSEVSLDVKSDLIGPHFSWTNSLGNALINTASIRIGGVLVDTIPGRLLEILDEFQTPLERVNEVSNQTCRQLNGFNQSSFGTQTTGQIVRTPLPFWFSRGDPGCFLPIDALNVDEVRLTVNFNPITSLYYTDSRATNPDGSFIKTATPGAGLWPMAGSKFFYEDSSGSILTGLEPINAPRKSFLPFPSVQMTTNLTMPESYLMVEYIYLDKPEANRFRIADIQVPVVQHYAFDPVDNQNNPYSRIPLIIPNPTRDLFFYCNRYEAQGYNASFLGTRDLSNTLIPGKLWWPDATGLDNHYYGTIKPGFSTRYSEPIRWLSLDYSETLNRYSTENVSLFRSVLPSLEQRKAPFVNRYYYNLPFGIQNGFTPFSMPIGEANLDKVLRMNLTLGFHGRTGNLTDDFVDRYNTYVFAETYNIFRVYGGRGGMMFAY